MTVSFMLNTKVCKFNKDGLQLAMINFFYPCPHKLQKLVL